MCFNELKYISQSFANDLILFIHRTCSLYTALCGVQDTIVQSSATATPLKYSVDALVITYFQRQIHTEEAHNSTYELITKTLNNRS